MAKALRESTGILILDEGHNLRSTKSRLRKGLMKVETELRILLSGTLFQNNFGEYFNTLYLERPKFVQEVLKELDIKQKKGNDKNPEKAQHLLETRARKFFLDDIANKIDSNDDEVRMVGSKVRFILSLIFRVVKEEKVLIFCRNLAPMKLLVQLFEEFFKWKKDGEILLLYGEQDLFERGKVIDKFEDPCGVSRVESIKDKASYCKGFSSWPGKDGLCVSTLGKRLNGGK
ncbi:SNF2-related, N-terminal domain [Sesbania bispinosa]|nr:SNF2-related, N-terminal domain [Sesbania bispinosa]